MDYENTDRADFVKAICVADPNCKKTRNHSKTHVYMGIYKHVLINLLLVGVGMTITLLTDDGVTVNISTSSILVSIIIGPFCCILHLLYFKRHFIENCKS